MSRFGNLFQEKIAKKNLKETDEVVFIGMQDVDENATIKNTTKLSYCNVKSGFTYFEKNDVLVAKITPCFENGKGGFADKIPTQIGFGSTEFHILRAKSEVDPRYVYFQTKRPRFRNELEGEMVGSAGHRRVPFSSIQKFELEVDHTFEEQAAIADALTDVDAVITALEKLIVKKRAIKAATMQQLLTGKKRLPPFDKSHTGYKQTELGEIPEDWKLVKFDSVCTIINGRGFKPYEWSQNGLPIIRIQNLNGSDDFNFYEGHFDSKILVQHGQLLFAWSGSRGTSFGPHVWHGGDAVLNYHTWKLVVDESKIDEGFFFHELKILTKIIEDSAHGASALVHTQKGEMEKFELAIPNSKEEQALISQVLSDMDLELDKLEQRLDKVRKIKQGMMQELLTGRTRLVAGTA